MAKKKTERKPLRAKTSAAEVANFGEKYFKDRLAQGINYAYYGDWQRNYAKLLVSITDVVEQAANDRTALFVDLGTACGVNLLGMKETKVFGNVKGFDISEYMIDLGKRRHGFSDDEMQVLNIVTEELPLEDNSVTMIHCSHTLEHVDTDGIPFILEEMNRVLSENGVGVIVIPAVKVGMSKDDIELGDQTHINVQTEYWWKKNISKFLSIDSAIRENFKENKFSPSMEKDAPSFYQNYKDSWTLFGVHKKN
jgi:ubiquinone/menaquinone biosynthesis C-methylase UbiE